jgi:hypothetical protein
LSDEPSKRRVGVLTNTSLCLLKLKEWKRYLNNRIARSRDPSSESVLLRQRKDLRSTYHGEHANMFGGPGHYPSNSVDDGSKRRRFPCQTFDLICPLKFVKTDEDDRIVLREIVCPAMMFGDEVESYLDG